MSTRDLDANMLDLFAMIVAEGSFSAAARRLKLTRAAVSRRIAALEERLGNPLFQRSTRALALTDFGRAIHVEARAVHEAARAARLAARQARSGLSGTLRLSTTTLFGRSLLAPLIAKFRTRHPAVQFDLQFTDRPVDLAAEGMDIAFRITATPPADCVATPLLAFTVGAYAAPPVAQALGRRTPTPGPADLESPGCLIVAHDLPQIRIDWRHHSGERLSIATRPAVQSLDLMSLIDIARAGNGVVLTPDFTTTSAVAQGELVRVLPDWEVDLPFGNAVLALTPPARYGSDKARQFLAFVRHEIDERGITPDRQVAGSA